MLKNQINQPNYRNTMTDNINVLNNILNKFYLYFKPIFYTCKIDDTSFDGIIGKFKYYSTQKVGIGDIAMCDILKYCICLYDKINQKYWKDPTIIEKYNITPSLLDKFGFGDGCIVGMYDMYTNKKSALNPHTFIDSIVKTIIQSIQPCIDFKLNMCENCPNDNIFECYSFLIDKFTNTFFPHAEYIKHNDYLQNAVLNIRYLLYDKTDTINYFRNLNIIQSHEKLGLNKILDKIHPPTDVKSISLELLQKITSSYTSQMSKITTGPNIDITQLFDEIIEKQQLNLQTKIGGNQHTLIFIAIIITFMVILIFIIDHYIVPKSVSNTNKHTIKLSTPKNKLSYL
jgi:hypothetical protein